MKLGVVLPAGILAAAAAFGPMAQSSAAPAITEYRGTCDASAAVAFGPGRFIVASDEDNVLRVYRLGRSDPVALFPLDDFVAPDFRKPELDIEAAAVIGNRIYWITSHGASRKGADRPSRRRLFATEISIDGTNRRVVPAGRPYRDLLDDLATAPALEKYRLGDAALIAPKETGALNIEGLAATAAGTLLVGFRNPLPGGKALLVEIENPDAVIRGARARLGPPIEIDLGGLGIRSIEATARGYLIIAGPTNGGGPFKLFKWSGKPHEATLDIPQPAFDGLHPEALFVTDTGDIYVLSDDGEREIEGRACKDAPTEERRFRGLQLAPRPRAGK